MKQEPRAEEYVGFGLRSWAALLDSLYLTLLLLPLALLTYGLSSLSTSSGGLRAVADFLFQIVLPLVLLFFFWKRFSATPGKMLLNARIVDSRTGLAPSSGQLTLRFAGYFISMIPLGLGFAWILMDRRKQAWHDKLAHTVVIREPGPLEHRTALISSTIVSALLLGAGLVAGGLWLGANLRDIQTGWEGMEVSAFDGIEAGIRYTAPQCWPRSLRYLESCEGYFCSQRTASFLQACLISSASPKEACEGVPDGWGELAGSEWRNQRCPGQNLYSCLLLSATLAQYCRLSGSQSE